MDALHWTLFGAIGLLSAGLFTLTYAHRQLDRRVYALETATTAEDIRRAHVRLDNEHRQLEALARELGWSDDRSHTRVLTERLPTPVKPVKPE